MRRFIASVALLVSTMAGVLVAAPAAQAAANTLTDAVCTAGVVNGAGFAATTGDTVSITATLSGCETVKVQADLVSSAADITVTGTGVGSVTLVSNNYVVNATTLTGIQVTLGNTSTVGPRVIGIGKTATYGTQRTQWIVTFTGSGGGGGGGGGGSSSDSTDTSAPASETLSLAVQASGASCSGGSPSGLVGTWLSLPSADQCSQSGASAKPGAKLLGWSTSSAFPVALAQHQLDMHWGVYDGDVDGARMIFIPGGGAVLVSGANTLFPIWGA